MRKRTEAVMWILVLALFMGFGNGIASADYSVYHGYFSAASPHKVDASAVTDFKNKISLIDSVSDNSVVEYAPQDMNIWFNTPYNPSGEANYQRGGAFYVTTAVYNLPADYSVRIDNNYLFDGDGGRDNFVSYWDPAAYTTNGSVLIGTSGNRISDWVRYSQLNPDGTYNLFLTAGLYNLADDGNAAAGFDLQLQRLVQILDGGNNVLYTDNFTNTASSVPIPGALLLFGPGLVGILAVRKRFKR